MVNCAAVASFGNNPLIWKVNVEGTLALARPSIVVGHTRHGCAPSSSIFWVFSMGLMLQKFMCSMEDRIDVVPVDYCADALLMLLNCSARAGDVVHISAGEENSVRFADIDRAMALALEKAPVGDKYAQVSYDTLVRMRRELKVIFGPCNERLMLKAMRLYGEFARLNVRFSNDKLLTWGWQNRRALRTILRAACKPRRGCPFRSKWRSILNSQKKCQSCDWHFHFKA